MDVRLAMTELVAQATAARAFVDDHIDRTLDGLDEPGDAAIATVAAPDVRYADGAVLDVVQKGYRLGDRVLRPALVGVAKGGPKAPANGSGESADNPSAAS